MTIRSDFSTELVSTPEIISKEIGDFKSNADVSYAEKLLESGISRIDETLVWGSEIERVKKEIRRIEKVRDFFLEPIKEAEQSVKAARKKQSSYFDPMIDFLTDIKKRLDSVYCPFVLKIEKEDKDAAIAAQEDAAKKIEESGKKDGNEFLAAIEADEILSTPINTHRIKAKTMTGSTSVLGIDRVRIVNPGIVPRAYCKPDEKKLLSDYKSGLITEVPGVEFYVEARSLVR